MPPRLLKRRKDVGRMCPQPPLSVCGFGRPSGVRLWLDGPFPGPEHTRAGQTVAQHVCCGWISLDDDGLVLARGDDLHRLVVHVEVGLHQLGRRQRQPLGQRDIGEAIAAEHLQEGQRLGAGVLSSAPSRRARSPRHPPDSRRCAPSRSRRRPSCAPARRCSTATRRWSDASAARASRRARPPPAPRWCSRRGSWRSR